MGYGRLMEKSKKVTAKVSWLCKNFHFMRNHIHKHALPAQIGESVRQQIVSNQLQVAAASSPAAEGRSEFTKWFVAQCNSTPGHRWLQVRTHLYNYTSCVHTTTTCTTTTATATTTTYNGSTGTSSDTPANTGCAQGKGWTDHPGAASAGCGTNAAQPPVPGVPHLPYSQRASLMSLHAPA